MACFAEVASQFREAGGPYLYARAAFGRLVGLQMGWLAWLVRLTASAAAANLFAIYLAEFWPQARDPFARALVLTLFVGVLAPVNHHTLAVGAQISKFIPVPELPPSALFIRAGSCCPQSAHPPPVPAA